MGQSMDCSPRPFPAEAGPRVTSTGWRAGSPCLSGPRWQCMQNEDGDDYRERGHGCCGIAGDAKDLAPGCPVCCHVRPGVARTAKGALVRRSGPGRPSEVPGWSGDGAHVGQVGAGLVVRGGVGVDDGAQEQSALQLDQPRGQRRQVAGAHPRVEHGTRRDIQRRLLDLGRQLRGAGLVQPGRTGRALRTLHAGQTGRAGRAGRALLALRALQAAHTSGTLLTRQTGQALHTWQPLLALLAGLADHTARALGAAQALLTLGPLLTGHALGAGLAAQSGQALRALRTLLAGAAGGARQTLLPLRTRLPLGALLAEGADLALRALLTPRADRALLAALPDRADRTGQALVALVAGLTNRADRALGALVAPLADRADRALGALVAGLAGGADRAGRTLRAAVTLLDGDLDGNRNGLAGGAALGLRHGRKLASHGGRSWPGGIADGATRGPDRSRPLHGDRADADPAGIGRLRPKANEFHHAPSRWQQPPGTR